MVALVEHAEAVLLPFVVVGGDYAAAYRHLRRQGTPIPTNDLRVGALSLQHDLALCARDRHFDMLPQLARV